MRLACLTAALALAAPFLPALATAAPSEDWSARIAADGLAATATAIEALAAPTPDDRLALGAARFLGGVEKALQARWAIGQSKEISFLPVFRLPLAPNPAPAPFDPALLETTLAGLSADMDTARAALADIPEAADIALDLRLEDLWLDINASGSRDPGEGTLDLAGFMLASQARWNPETGQMMPPPQVPATIPVTFDTADAAWLSAYTHLLSATSDLVRAFAPTEPVRRVYEGRMAMAKAGIGGLFDLNRQAGTSPARYPNEIDAAAMAILALRQQPLPERTRAARDHFLAMIADNRRFWTLVAAETDNRQEWIPNATQTAALGMAFPQGMDIAWQDVLADGEKLLKGELLVPYRAAGDPQAGIGFDIGGWLESPGPIDLVEWLHGMGMQPWLKQGALVDSRSWAALEQMTSGNALLFAVFLN